jgi:SNF2 family DNA or RNA helicase
MNAEELGTARSIIEERLKATEENNSNGKATSVAAIPAKTAAPMAVVPTEVKEDVSDANEMFKRCVIAIASACDGAGTWDGQGFNKPDSSTGRWTARQFQQGRTISRKQAAMVHKKMIKYKVQLSKNGLVLPTWEEIEACYPETNTTPKQELRVELANNGAAIAVFTTPEKKDHFKVLGYIKFDWETKAWLFAPEKVVEVVNVAEELGGYHIDLGCQQLYDKELELRHREEEARRQRALEAATEITQLIEAAKLDEAIACGWKLFEHQKQGAQWLLAHGKAGIYGGGILADQMGLGKTIEALVAAKAVKAVYGAHIMVVCPSSLKDNWLIEAEKVGVKIDVFSWQKMPLPLERTQYVLIADEAHYAQNPKSQRSKAVKELAKHDNCLYAWMLTGTPLKNGRPINLLPLLEAVDHPLSHDRRAYEKRYCQAGYKVVNSRTGKQVWDNQGAACLDDLAKMTQDVILQRKKHDCLDLPEKLRSLRPVDLSAADEATYNSEIKAAVADFRRRAELGEVDPDAEVLVTLQALRRIGSKYKAAAAIEAAQELLESGEQVIIFTEFLESAKAIAATLGETTSVELLTGDVESDKRQDMVERFQAGKSKAFVGTIRAGGVGLTLTAASYVIMCDRPWTPGDAEQAEDRAHRIGQKSTVNAIWLQLSDIDIMIDALLGQKQQRIDLVMSGKRKTLRGIGNINDLAKELIAAL